MTADQAFLYEIEAAPHATDPRLIYADWLEEQGDPRGEFIQLWHEMESLKPWSERYGQCAARRRSLRDRIDEQWLKHLGYNARYQPMFTELPPDRHSRWQLLTTFLECWYEPLTEQDQVSQSVLDGAEWHVGQPLPATLKEWYLHSGYAQNIWSRPGAKLIEPGKLMPHSKENLLPIIEVCSGDRQMQRYHWPLHFADLYALRLSQLGMDDPPVYSVGSANSPKPVGASLSTFILFWAAYSTTLCSPTPRWLATVTRSSQYIGEGFSTSALPEITIEESAVTVFESADVLGVSTGESLRLCSHSEDAASPIIDLVPPTEVWNRVDEQWVPQEERRSWPDGFCDDLD